MIPLLVFKYYVGKESSLTDALSDDEHRLS